MSLWVPSMCIMLALEAAKASEIKTRQIGCEKKVFRGSNNIDFETIMVRHSTENIQPAVGLDGKRFGNHF